MQVLENLVKELDEAITYLRQKKAKELVTKGINLSKKFKKPDYYYYFLGEKFLIDGKLEEAINYFLFAINKNQLNVHAYNELANTLADLGYLDKALLYINKALRIDKNYPILYNNKGFFLKEKGNLEEALYYFNKALDLDGNFLVAYINKADVLLELGFNKEALACYKIAWDLALKKEEIVCIKYIKNKLKYL